MTPLSQWKHRLYNWLARREYSAREAKDRLLRSGCPASLATVLIDDCCDKKLIDDQRFVEHYTRSLLRRGYGASYIRYQMQQKGVDEQLVQCALAAIDWRDQIAYTLRRRYGDRTVSLASQRGFLYRKGYNAQHLHSYFGRENTEDMD